MCGTQLAALLQAQSARLAYTSAKWCPIIYAQEQHQQQKRADERDDEKLLLLLVVRELWIPFLEFAHFFLLLLLFCLLDLACMIGFLFDFRIRATVEWTLRKSIPSNKSSFFSFHKRDIIAADSCKLLLKSCSVAGVDVLLTLIMHP